MRTDFKDLPKLYVTPLGVFSVLNDLVRLTKIPRWILKRRCTTTKTAFKDWYILDDNTPIMEEDTCKGCSLVDNLLFKEGCWLDRVIHTHHEDLTDDDIIRYFHKGSEYTTTYSDWINGIRLHTNGDKNDADSK